MIFPVLIKTLLTAKIMIFIRPFPCEGVADGNVSMATGVFNKIFSSRQIFLMTLWNRFDRSAARHEKQLPNPVDNIK
jgi:hypothetical protein